MSSLEEVERSTDRVDRRATHADRAPRPVTGMGAPFAAFSVRKLVPDPRYYAPLFITGVLLAAHLSVGLLESPWQTGLAIVTSLVTELILGRLYFGKWPHLASAYVSGISVGILVRSSYYWPFALCAAISIASKYVFRIRDRHLWNPSNFGIAALLLVAHAMPHGDAEWMSTLSVQFGNSVGPMVVIWMLGSFIVSRLRRFHICATYVVSFFAFALLRALITGKSFESQYAPITGPMYQLFTFFMITDPKTTVRTQKGQMLVAFLVAAMEAVLRLAQNIHAPYFALFTVGPVANGVEIWLDARRARRKQGLQP